MRYLAARSRAHSGAGITTLLAGDAASGRSPLCFRFIILFTMLRQTSASVPLPEDIPDQRSQFHSVSL
ncbi:hypothetical protein MJ579_13760 [Klebsiella pneumoniae]|nr:hypothetical protein MJ579_13760 [Klebsiella pneumoniae]